jgi:nucleoside-diphosphate-sugar epimerase
MKFTVFGAAGFIGSHLVRHLRAQGIAVETPARGERPADLGHAVWCAGVTADFRRRPFDTVIAHVSDLVPLLQEARFDSLVYVSSTRVYQSSPSTDEGQPLTVSSTNPSDLYNLSKLMGESICLAQPNVRVARLSNVYGSDFTSDNFLTQLIKAALDKKLVMQTAPESSKDYVSVDDVAEFLTAIALDGREPIYNLASGANLTNLAIADALARITRCEVEWIPGAPTISFPPIPIHRLQSSFAKVPSRNLLDDLEGLVESYAKS